MARKKLAVRKTPRQERSVATVEAILQAATYILTKRGRGAFTTNEVARRAGVNIASLYQYFPNKESIVAELQRRHIEEMKRRCRELPPASSPIESLHAVIEAAVVEHKVDPALHRVFAEDLPRAHRIAAPRPDSQLRWEERLAPFTNVPDQDLACFVARVVVHAVIHEAAAERPDLLDHPLLVPELVRLLGAYLLGR